MTNSVLCRRYAHAAFDLGVRQGGDVISRRGRVFEALEALLEECAPLKNVFFSPRFSAEEKKRVIAAILEELDCDAKTRNFLFVLADKKRLPEFRGIAAEYRRLLDKAVNIVRGTVTTAVPLSDAKKASVRDDLQAKAGATLELDYRVDPAILGGVVLRIGDRLLDSSLRTQLEKLRESLKRG